MTVECRATVFTPQLCNQSANRCKSAVKHSNRRTGSGSRSGPHGNVMRTIAHIDTRSVGMDHLQARVLRSQSPRQFLPLLSVSPQLLVYRHPCSLQWKLGSGSARFGPITVLPQCTARFSPDCRLPGDPREKSIRGAPFRLEEPHTFRPWSGRSFCAKNGSDRDRHIFVIILSHTNGLLHRRPCIPRCEPVECPESCKIPTCLKPDCLHHR